MQQVGLIELLSDFSLIGFFENAFTYLLEATDFDRLNSYTLVQFWSLGFKKILPIAGKGEKEPPMPRNRQALIWKFLEKYGI